MVLGSTEMETTEDSIATDRPLSTHPPSALLVLSMSMQILAGLDWENVEVSTVTESAGVATATAAVSYFGSLSTAAWEPSVTAVSHAVVVRYALVFAVTSAPFEVSVMTCAIAAATSSGVRPSTAVCKGHFESAVIPCTTGAGTVCIDAQLVDARVQPHAGIDAHRPGAVLAGQAVACCGRPRDGSVRAVVSGRSIAWACCGDQVRLRRGACHYNVRQLNLLTNQCSDPKRRTLDVDRQPGVNERECLRAAISVHANFYSSSLGTDWWCPASMYSLDRGNQRSLHRWCPCSQPHRAMSPQYMPVM